MDRREALEIITGGIQAKAAKERGERVEADPIEDTIDPLEGRAESREGRRGRKGA
jgi:hypothetical protein